ncbi:MAG: hypothetical protein IJH53_03630 [Oscillospiraceae bacterium]|nr:hypothetical protein [Oscillospiraceae bacterium]
MKKTILSILILALVLSLSVFASGCASEPAASVPAAQESSQAVKDVIAMIDAIPQLAEDGSNASEVYDAYTAAQSAYFQLSYDEMNAVNNVGGMWKASDDYYQHIMNTQPKEDYEYYQRAAEAGALLAGTWYDSSSVIYKEYNCWQISFDGTVVTPFYNEETQYVQSLGNGEYYIPDYGTIYPDYSMGEMRLASVDGRGCLISQVTIDKMYVKVELSAENVADYFTFDQIYSYVDEWGDYANYADNGQTCYAAVNKYEGSDMTYIGSDGAQVELFLKNGTKTTFYGIGLFQVDGKNVAIKEFGRAKGTLWFVRSEYVWKTETNDGFVYVYLNDGSLYTYYHGEYAYG